MWLKIFIILILLMFLIPAVLSGATLFYLFIASPVQISGVAMTPNYPEGQYWIINRMKYRFSLPKRGDIIIFVSPKQSDMQLIKRIIGLPGDRISIKSGAVILNDQPYAESYIPQDMKTYGGSFLQDNTSLTVPDESYFVLGDNRIKSTDSREWGFISRGAIVGALWFRYR